ncbi:outer membrane beta-barrel family protein [Sanguibacteroides justesenii]|uniref:TonB-dependent receptor n=1 Tax=Sanguibacteroides justesenii TaxID=1547597 RepID=A0AB34R612_9PORP|nr:outer membrane beta-barrel family protein [Sanguibacteroides justesenii]KIO46826.1 TonB-dependent receptor [Sanguibacteroides justesenii]
MQIGKIIRFIVCFIVLYSFYSVVYGQTITGKVIDNEQQPIAGATIVLQTIDSIYISAVISDTNGVFILNNQPKEYRLIIQHLSYQTKQITSSEQNVGIIQLQPNILSLDEVMIKAERPLVKVKNGRLEYNLQALAEKKAVNNAYEALTKLPGIQEKRGVLSLAGAEKLTVVLNGKPTTMNAGQLETLLRNTPVNRIEKAEIMYSAPPEYHTRGAIVNVVLKRSNDYSFQGEISTHYKNQYFNKGGVNGNLRLSTPKLTLDVMYGADNTKQMEYIDLYSRHTLKDETYNIVQNEQLRSKYWNYNIRTSLEYNFNKKNNISVAYTRSFTPNQHNSSLTTRNYQTGNIDKYIDIRMHNIALQYNSEFGLTVGGDYTHYISNNDQNMYAKYQEGVKSSFTMIGEQKIDRYSIYAGQKHKLPKGWNLGYGASYRLVKDRDFQTYSEVTGTINPQNMYSNLQEQTTDFYLSLNKNFETGLSISLSVTGEYYTIRDYHKWAIYPQASLTYSKTPKHTLQLSLSTDKTDPSYWDMQSTVSYLNGYTELWGTPGLKPSTSYNLNGSFILKRKYIFNLFFTHALDYFAQTPYQSTERLTLIYKNTNWNYMQSWGANVIVPFSVRSWLDSRLTLTGMQVSQRCNDFFDIPFNRKKRVFNVALDNTFKVKKNLAFELMGFVQTPTIQGTFNIGSIFDLTAGMKWNFANDKFSFSARCNDIFNTGMPKTNVRFKGQYLDMNSGFYSRAFTINFIYRFGGYKRKEVKRIDTSRFGH